MNQKKSEQISSQEHVLIVIVDSKYEITNWTPDQILIEMNELVKACGGYVQDTTVVPLNKPSAGLLISEVKVEDVAALAAMRKVDTVIFSHDLKPSQ